MPVFDDVHVPLAAAAPVSIGVTLAVVAAGLLHALWNAAAHGGADRAIGFVLIGATSTVLGLALVPWSAVPAGGAWPYLGCSAAVHATYNLLLLRSYQLGDFGQTYPLARGISPLVVGVIAVTIVGQPLPLWHAVGLVSVCGGLGFVAFGGGGLRGAHTPALVAAGLTGLAIATYTVLDGVGVRHAHSTLGYVAWLFVLQSPVLPIGVAVRRGVLATLRACRPQLAMGVGSGVVSVLAYGIVIWAQTRATLASVAATREVSILFGAIIGHFAFREPFGRWRVAGAVLTVAGIVALNVA
jgi:drug/metabolite transporter (DMT)-like permease